MGKWEYRSVPVLVSWPLPIYPTGTTDRSQLPALQEEGWELVRITTYVFRDGRLHKVERAEAEAEVGALPYSVVVAVLKRRKP